MSIRQSRHDYDPTQPTGSRELRLETQAQQHKWITPEHQDLQASTGKDYRSTQAVPGEEYAPGDHI